MFAIFQRLIVRLVLCFSYAVDQEKQSTTFFTSINAKSELADQVKLELVKQNGNVLLRSALMNQLGHLKKVSVKSEGRKIIQIEHISSYENPGLSVGLLEIV